MSLIESVNHSTTPTSSSTAASPTLRARIYDLLSTPTDPTATLARVVLALVLFPHGAQHLLGWFGGYGFAGTYGWMRDVVGIPGPIAAFSIILEFFGPLLLLTGLASRPIALALGVFMAVAASTHSANGFFMNWFGNQRGEGFEYHLLAIALAAVVAFRGGGAWSVDRILLKSYEDRS